MQTVLVTGADGFIGSHLTEMLLDKGYQVRALAQYNSFNNWGWLGYLKYKNGWNYLQGKSTTQLMHANN